MLIVLTGVAHINVCICVYRCIVCLFHCISLMIRERFSLICLVYVVLLCEKGRLCELYVCTHESRNELIYMSEMLLVNVFEFLACVVSLTNVLVVLLNVYERYLMEMFLYNV